MYMYTLCYVTYITVCYLMYVYTESYSMSHMCMYYVTLCYIYIHVYICCSMSHIRRHYLTDNIMQYGLLVRSIYSRIHLQDCLYLNNITWADQIMTIVLHMCAFMYYITWSHPCQGLMCLVPDWCHLYQYHNHEGKSNPDLTKEMYNNCEHHYKLPHEWGLFLTLRNRI